MLLYWLKGKPVYQFGRFRGTIKQIADQTGIPLVVLYERFDLWEVGDLRSEDIIQK